MYLENYLNKNRVIRLPVHAKKWPKMAEKHDFGLFTGLKMPDFFVFLYKKYII